MTLTLAEKRRRKQVWRTDGFGAVFIGAIAWYEPVFHRTSEVTVDGTRNIWRTYCGRVIQLYDRSKPDGSRLQNNSTVLPTHHAVRFARPCSKCYREQS